MAKNRIRNKKRNGSSSMDIEDEGVCNLPQAMDTSESGTQKLASGSHNLKLKKGRQMKRSKNVRKMKARAKAIAINDKRIPQAMDTSESGTQKLVSGSHNLKLKKGRQMKRSKNIRKMNARAKGIAINDKIVEKVSKKESKTKRTQLAKTLYE